MNLIYKRFYTLCVVVCGFFSTLQASTGTFEKTSPPKPVRISVSSQKFLKSVVSDLRLIHSKTMINNGSQEVSDIVQLCVELSDFLQKQDFLTHDDLEKIQKIILLEKQCLADRIGHLRVNVTL